MNKILWVVTVLVAFAAGYLLRGVPAQEPLGTKVPLQAALNSAADCVVATAVVGNNASAQLATTQKIASAATASVAALATDTASLQNSRDSSVSSETEKSEATQYPNEISDEEIDAVLTAPFGVQLKNTHGILREKYKPFLESSKQDAWDVKMQNKITDFMLGNAYSKFITVESIACRTNFCEMRVIELKQGVAGLIIAEMSMQDWWDIGVSQFTANQFTGVPVMYGLLMRK